MRSHISSRTTGSNLVKLVVAAISRSIQVITNRIITVRIQISRK